MMQFIFYDTSNQAKLDLHILLSSLTLSSAGTRIKENIPFGFELTKSALLVPLRNPRFLEASLGQKEKSECPSVRPSGYDTTKSWTTHFF